MGRDRKRETVTVKAFPNFKTITETWETEERFIESTNKCNFKIKKLTP